MKKVFRSIILAFGAGLILSPAVHAAGLKVDGNYAVLIQGLTPDQQAATATGLAPFPAPVAAIGLLQINGSSVTGELMYSTGTAVTAPATCSDTEAPCFDGSTSSITNGSLTFDASGLGTLTFESAGVTQPFAFAIAIDAKGKEFRGTSTPAVEDEATAPIISIVGEWQKPFPKAKPTSGEIADGKSVLAGNFSLSCNGQGVQGTNTAPSILGPGALSIAGIISIPAVKGKGNPPPNGTGSVTLNGNNGFITTLGSQVAAPSFVCNVTQTISTDLGIQSDGTVNASETVSGDTCDLSNLTEMLGLGDPSLQMSAVFWGSSDQNAFGIITQLSATGLSSPPAIVATCDLSRQ